MLENLWYILAIILGFGFLILVHELGHFLVARSFKVRCPYFAIGMGVMGQMPPVVAWRKNIGLRIMKGTDQEWADRCLSRIAEERGVAKEQLVIVETLEKPEDLQNVPANCRVKRAQLFEASDALGLGETEYRLMALPLGGYVAMEGQEDLDPAAKSEDPRAFNNQPIYARAAILSAGVVMNVIFGFLFFIIAFGIGVDFPAPVIGGVNDQMPAASVYAEGRDGDPEYKGLQPGDRVLNVNGTPIREFQEVVMAVALGQPGQDAVFVIQRPGVDEPLTYRIPPQQDAAMERLMSVGIRSAPSLTIESVADGSDAAEAGVKPGMTLAALNGTPITDLSRLVRWSQDHAASDPVRVSLSAEGGERGEHAELTVLPVPSLIISETDADQPAAPAGFFGLYPVAKLYPQKDGAAMAAGVEAGDIAVQIGSVPWPADVTDVQQALAQAKGDPVSVQVMRGGQIKDLGAITPRNGLLGVQVRSAFDGAWFGRPVDGSVAAQASLPSGSRLLAINEQPIENWSHAQAVLQGLARSGADSVQIQVMPLTATDEPMVFSAPLDETTKEQLLATDWYLMLSLAYAGINMKPDMVTLKATGPIDAMGIGVSRVKAAGQQVYITLLRLFQRSVSVKNLRGPVGIVDAGSKIARQGFTWFLYFLGLISINLAVLNFLPLPIVDGGHIAMLGYEKIKGEPAGPRVQNAMFIAGLALLGSLFLIVTYHDIVRLIVGG